MSAATPNLMQLLSSQSFYNCHSLEEIQVPLTQIIEPVSEYLILYFSTYSL